MKGIDSTGAHLVHVPGWMDGWVDGWMEVKAVLRIAYSNQKEGLPAPLAPEQRLLRKIWKKN